MFESFISLTIQLSIPIVLGALCGTIAERGGIIMLGVEGMMLVGAFCGALGSFISGNPWMGVLLALAVGFLLGLVYCMFCVRFRAHQSVVGVGMNLLASGLTAVLLKAVWGQEGMGAFVKTVPNINLRFLSNIPVLRILHNQSPYLLFMFVSVALTWTVFYRTKIGLRYRAIGDQPLAVHTAGVNVNRYRYAALAFAGMLAALGGSYLSISYNNLFVSDMVAGRGFMALAASIFGGWTPLGCLYASSIFAFAQAGRYYLSDVGISQYFIQMIPYVSTLLILMFTGKSARMPEALGKLVD